MRVFFLRDRNRFPVACVAAEVLGTDAGFEEPMVKYAVACYNPKDTFAKAQARKVAEGRLTNGGSNLFATKLNPWIGATETLLNHLRRNIKVPHSGRRAATEWFRVHRPRGGSIPKQDLLKFIGR